MEDQLFRRLSAGQRGDLVQQLLPAHQVVLILVHLHGIAQRAGGPGNNRNLGHRGGMGLHGRHQGVPDLVVGNDLLFLLAHHGVLPLIAGDDRLHAFHQVFLRHLVPAHPDRPQGGLVDDVGQLRAAGAAGCPGDLLHVDGSAHFDVPGVHLQNRFPARQIRQLHRDPPVEPARPQQRGIQGFRPVRGRQNDHALVPVKSVHLRQQLVQGLLPLVVSADAASRVPLLADGVDLVDEHDAGGLLIRLLEQVADLRRAHAHEHFHKLGSGDGEEGYLRLPGHRLRQQGFARAGRAHQQRALGQLRADPGVLARVLQEVHNFLQRVLCFFLSGHVREGHAGLLFRHNLGVRLSEAHGVHPAAQPFPQLLAQQAAQAPEDDDGDNPAKQQAHQRTVPRGNLRAESHAGVFKPFPQALVWEHSGLEYLFLVRVVLRDEDDLVVLLVQGNLRHPSLVNQLQKVAVSNLLHLPRQQHGHHKSVQREDDDHGNRHIKNQRFFAGILVVEHISLLPAGCKRSAASIGCGPVQIYDLGNRSHALAKPPE